MVFEIGVSQFAQSAHGSPPDRLGQRYTAERFLPEAGNTVVCHLGRDTPTHAAVLRARMRMAALPEAGRRLQTPADSLHMTLFEGVIDTRRRADAWPEGIDRMASVEVVTVLLAERLKGLKAPPAFNMALAGMTPNGLILRGASDADAAALALWREGLAEVFGYRHAEHDAYQYHMTFAYMVEWLPDEVLPEWEAGLAEICAELAEAVPVIPLRAPAFCRFADMTRFEELVGLG